MSTKISSWLIANSQAFMVKLPALIELTRANRPIGIYLLLWPTISALWIAGAGSPDLGLVLIFILGTAIMRSAGCCVNDFADYDIDGRVARTRDRPLVKGELRRRDALYCFLVLSLVGFLLVLLTNTFTILLSFGAVLVAALYPFMKRYTNLPQVVLGVAFSWGILMAFSAQLDSIPLAAYLLFLANIMWTVAYDTEYAMVDREFDRKIGVKSTAILFGDMDRAFIGALQIMFVLALWLAARQFGLGWPFYLSILVSSALLIYQQFLIRERLPAPCFKAFLNNNIVGAVLFAGVVLSYV